MVSTAYPLWVWKGKELEQGEWTKTQSLVLTTAVEGMLLATEDASWDIDCLGLLRSFRYLRTIDRKRAGSADPDYFNSHRTTYAVRFEMPSVDIEVLVELRCDLACNNAGIHNWVYRDVHTGRFPTDHSIRGLVWAYGGSIDAPLTWEGYCSYQPNLIYDS